MNLRLRRVALLCATAAAALAFAPVRSAAQSTGDFISSGGAVANSAADMLRQEIAARRAARDAANAAAHGRRQSQDVDA